MRAKRLYLRPSYLIGLDWIGCCRCLAAVATRQRGFTILHFPYHTWQFIVIFFTTFTNSLTRSVFHSELKTWLLAKSFWIQVKSVTDQIGDISYRWHRFLVTSVLRLNCTSNSVLGHFGPKDRTDLDTFVLRKAKLLQCICILYCIFTLYVYYCPDKCSLLKNVQVIYAVQ